MIDVYKYFWGINTWEGKEEFKQKDDNIGIRTNGYNLAMNIFMLETRRRIQGLTTIRFWESFPVGVVGARNLAAFRR